MERDEIIKKTIETNHGFIRAKDLVFAKMPTIYLTRYVKKHNLLKLAPGFYATEEWNYDGYFLLQHSFSGFIFSFSSAIYLHGLGDIMPAFYEVTGPKNYRPISLERPDVVAHTDTRKEIYELGITTTKTVFGNYVRVYDIEKTICDLIRFKEKVDIEVFLKAIRLYAKRKDKDLNKLYMYARKMKIEKKVISVMEIVLNKN